MGRSKPWIPLVAAPSLLSSFFCFSNLSSPSNKNKSQVLIIEQLTAVLVGIRRALFAVVWLMVMVNGDSRNPQSQIAKGRVYGYWENKVQYKVLVCNSTSTWYLYIAHVHSTYYRHFDLLIATQSDLSSTSSHSSSLFRKSCVSRMSQLQVDYYHDIIQSVSAYQITNCSHVEREACIKQDGPCSSQPTAMRYRYTLLAATRERQAARVCYNSLLHAKPVTEASQWCSSPELFTWELFWATSGGIARFYTTKTSNTDCSHVKPYCENYVCEIVLKHIFTF